VGSIGLNAANVVVGRARESLKAPASVRLLRTREEIEPALDGLFGLRALLTLAGAVIASAAFERFGGVADEAGRRNCPGDLAAEKPCIGVVNQLALTLRGNLPRANNGRELAGQTARTSHRRHLHRQAAACAPFDGVWTGRRTRLGIAATAGCRDSRCTARQFRNVERLT
jgi:hypothetical protein